MLEALNVCKVFGSYRALDSVTLRVEPGEIYCLLGANGAGKTTLVNLFLDFLEPTSGEVKINGRSVSEHPVECKRNVAYIPETVMLYGVLSGYENLKYFASLATGERHSRETLIGLLEEAGLDPAAADRRVASYSKGMRQKVGIAIAFCFGAAEAALTMASSSRSTVTLIMRHELRVMIADRTLPAIAALFTVLMLYGFCTGLHETQQREHVVNALVAGEARTNANNIAHWRKVMTRQVPPERFANPVDPSSIGGSMGAQYAILPTLALSPVAAGQSDMLADYYHVTVRSRSEFMEAAEIESPWKLLSGQFDLAFVLIYMFPLFIFAISFNMLSVERDQGTLRMLLSQPLSLRQLVLAKTLVRAGVIIGLAVLVPALAVISTRHSALDAAALSFFAFWMALLIAYGLFWFTLSALVNSLGRASATNALLLIGTWVLLVLVVPVTLNLAVSRLHPAPSRTDLAAQTRLVTIDGLNRYKDQFSQEYDVRPEALLPRDGRLEVASRLRAFYLMEEYVDQRLADVLARFERQLALQQALVDRFGFVSPAIIAHEGMASLAGNGTRRYERFKQQVVSYHEAWRAYFVPRVRDGIAIIEEDFARFPRWSWREESPANVRLDALLQVAQLLTVAVVMGLFAAWRFSRRYSV